MSFSLKSKARGFSQLPRATRPGPRGYSARMLWTPNPRPLAGNTSTWRSASYDRANGVQSDEAVVRRGPGRVALGRKPAGFRLPNLKLLIVFGHDRSIGGQSGRRDWR